MDTERVVKRNGTMLSLVYIMVKQQVYTLHGTSIRVGESCKYKINKTPFFLLSFICSPKLFHRKRKDQKRNNILE